MENQESDLLNAFKLAANSVALLYREANQNGEKQYEQGYNQALADIYSLLQKNATLDQLKQFLTTRKISLPKDNTLTDLFEIQPELDYTPRKRQRMETDD